MNNELSTSLRRLAREAAASAGHESGVDMQSSSSVGGSGAAVKAPAPGRDQWAKAGESKTGGSSARKKKNRSKKKKSMVAAAKPLVSHKRPEGMSKYTGLPKSHGAADVQEELVKSWIAAGHKFPTVSKLNQLIKSIGVELPKTKKKLRRLDRLVACGLKYGIVVTIEGVSALARSKQPLREFYDVLCALFGIECRSENATKSEFGAFTALVEPEDGDDEKHLEMKRLMKWAISRRKEMQREWQGLVNAFRKSHQSQIDEMRVIESDIANLNAHLTGTHFRPEDLTSTRDDSLFRGMSGGGDEVSRATVDTADEAESSKIDDDEIKSLSGSDVEDPDEDEEELEVADNDGKSTTTL